MSVEKSSCETVQIALRGSVSLSLLLPVLPQIKRVAQRKTVTCVQLDCSQVTDISSQALAELLKLRRDVRALGCDLVLVHCTATLATGIENSIFRSLLAEAPAAKQEAAKTPALQGPHASFQAKWKSSRAHKKGKPREPYFLSLHGTRYQRFWLN